MITLTQIYAASPRTACGLKIGLLKEKLFFCEKSNINKRNSNVSLAAQNRQLKNENKLFHT